MGEGILEIALEETVGLRVVLVNLEGKLVLEVAVPFFRVDALDALGGVERGRRDRGERRVAGSDEEAPLLDQWVF